MHKFFCAIRHHVQILDFCAISIYNSYFRQAGAVEDMNSWCGDSFVVCNDLVTRNISDRVKLAKLINHGVQQDMVDYTGVW